jgi:hypothetical protein
MLWLQHNRFANFLVGLFNGAVMNRIFGIILAAVALVLPSGALYAAPLEKTSQEYAQLQAMGYELDPAETSTTWTIAKAMSGAKIVISKDGQKTFAGRFFTRERQDLNQEQKLELLTLVNQVNIDLSYQVSLDDKYLIVALYYTGPYNPGVFANLVRQLEISNSIFDKYPNLSKLLRK